MHRCGSGNVGDAATPGPPRGTDTRASELAAVTRRAGSQAREVPSRARGEARAWKSAEGAWPLSPPGDAQAGETAGSASDSGQPESPTDPGRNSGSDSESLGRPRRASELAKAASPARVADHDRAAGAPNPLSMQDTTPRSRSDPRAGPIAPPFDSDSEPPLPVAAASGQWHRARGVLVVWWDVCVATAVDRSQ